MHTAIQCPECGSDTYRADGQTPTCLHCEGTGINLAVRLARQILSLAEAGEYGGLDRLASELAALLADIRKDLIAERAAVHIAHELPHLQPGGGVEIVYRDDRRPPTAVEDIKRELLDGCLWVSWMDDRVFTAMRRIHSEPGTAPVAIA